MTWSQVDCPPCQRQSSHRFLLFCFSWQLLDSQSQGCQLDVMFRYYLNFPSMLQLLESLFSSYSNLKGKLTWNVSNLWAMSTVWQRLGCDIFHSTWILRIDLHISATKTIQILNSNLVLFLWLYEKETGRNDQNLSFNGLKTHSGCDSDKAYHQIISIDLWNL